MDDKQRIRCACLVLSEDADYQKQVSGWMRDMWLAQLNTKYDVELLTKALTRPPPPRRHVQARPRAIQLKPRAVIDKNLKHKLLEGKSPPPPPRKHGWVIDIYEQRKGEPNSTDKGFRLGRDDVLFVWCDRKCAELLDLKHVPSRETTYVFVLENRKTLPEDALSPLPHLVFPEDQPDHSFGWGAARKQLVKSAIRP